MVHGDRLSVKAAAIALWIHPAGWAACPALSGQHWGNTSSTNCWKRPTVANCQKVL